MGDALTIGRSFEPDDERWYALWTFPAHERRVFNELNYLGFTGSLPEVEETVIQRGRKMDLKRVVFTGYCFVRIALWKSTHWRQIMEIDGVGGFLGDGVLPAVVPYDELSPHIYNGILAFLKKHDRSLFKSNRAKRREIAWRRRLANPCAG